MQLFDIAQDIIEDSKRGQCYIPLCYFPNDEYQFITEQHDGSYISDEILIECDRKLMRIVKEMWYESIPGIYLLPRMFQPVFTGLMLMFWVEEEKKIATGLYKNHENFNKFSKYLIVLKCLFLQNQSEFILGLIK